MKDPRIVDSFGLYMWDWTLYKEKCRDNKQRKEDKNNKPQKKLKRNNTTQCSHLKGALTYEH